MNATNNVTKKLSILVVEDTFKHQQAARLQLADHDVTIVGSYAEGNQLIYENKGKWDVVLLDLMLPASMCSLGEQGKVLGGQIMPLGTILALLAIKNGCKCVAIVTDTNHHDHPASAAFDWFGWDAFQVGDVSLYLTNRGSVEADSETFQLLPEGWFKEGGEEKYPNRTNVKPWKKALEKVLGTYEGES